MNYNFCLLLFVIISFLLLYWLFSVVHESHAGVLKMPLVSNSLKDYGVLEVIWKRKWFRERLLTRCVRFFFFLITTCFILNSINRYCSFPTGETTRIATVWRLAKFWSQSDGLLWKLNFMWSKIFFSESFCLKPIITLLTA